LLPAETPGANKEARHTIAVTATFTAEPLEPSLGFWMNELEIACDVRFAAYNQVFQELLNPAGTLGSNRHGLNVVLVRLEDWFHSSDAASVRGDAAREFERNVADFLATLKSAAERSAAPHLLCLCPSSQEAANAEFLKNHERLLAESLRQNGAIHVVTSAELSAQYPVANYEDRQADKVGHVPYTQEFFNALGTIIARRFYRLHTPPHKVIVLDCDQTLWRGICGEEGALAVKVDADARALQEFALRQREAGMLLCLCSKNNEEDAWKAFEQNPGMVLKREHIVAWRINWQPKSENLRSLAHELQLGLDSFIFLDDSGMECGEVEARCPEVLTLQLPASNLSGFLSHVWAFDHLKITNEDQQRSELYSQNAQREHLREQSLSLEDFLAGLELHLEISKMQPADLPRVAQITQRTNQFNFTTIRRTESEIEQMCQSGGECHVVRLRDRFGDYGLVGAMMFKPQPGMIEVENLLLSCRALGRRVEHRMLKHLGEIAQSQGLKNVRIKFVPTRKNQPALQFLVSVGSAFAARDGEAVIYTLPASRINELCEAMPLETTAVASETSASAPASIEPVVKSQESAKSQLFRRIATEFNCAAAISREIDAQKSVQHRDDEGYVAPESPIQLSLAELWSELLKVDRIGVDDNFFELGGQSLTAMQLAFQIQAKFNVDFSLETLLQAPVLQAQAQLLEENLIQQADVHELEQLVNEIEKA